MMKRSRFCEEQITAILKKHQAALGAKKLHRKHGVSQTWVEKAQDQATQWLWTYNNEGPNTGISGMTPAIKLKTAA